MHCSHRKSNLAHARSCGRKLGIPWFQVTGQRKCDSLMPSIRMAKARHRYQGKLVAFDVGFVYQHSGTTAFTGPRRTTLISKPA